MFKKIHGGILVLGSVLLLAGCATGRNYQSDIDALNSRISALQGQVSAKDEEISKLQDQLSQAEAERQRLNQKLDTASAKPEIPTAPESDLK